MAHMDRSAAVAVTDHSTHAISERPRCSRAQGDASRHGLIYFSNTADIGTDQMLYWPLSHSCIRARSLLACAALRG
jgi:hypothetical protein